MEVSQTGPWDGQMDGKAFLGVGCATSILYVKHYNLDFGHKSTVWTQLLHLKMTNLKLGNFFVQNDLFITLKLI